MADLKETIKKMEAHEQVPAGDIAPIVGMKPDRIREYARSGQWPREVCNYVISGSHVKFFRVDFLRKGGWIT